MRRIIISILAVMMLSATAFCADLNITEGPDCDVETITFEVPEGVSKGWFPLEKVAKYLPIKVTQDAKNSKWTRITIHDLESGKIFTNKDFEFNPKDYPEAEVIDLR